MAIPGDDFIINEELRHTLLPEQKDVIVQDLAVCLQESPAVIFSYLHGSFLEDSFFRDIDVAVYYDETVPAAKRLDLSCSLATALSRRAGYPVDVHSLNEASPGFRYHATCGRVLTSRDAERRFDFLERTWMTYFDYLPVQRQILADLLPGLVDPGGGPPKR